MKNNKRYKTEKLIFAAYLVANNKAELVGVEPTGIGRQVRFILSYEPTDIERAEFFSGKGRVSALKLSHALNNLKSAAYESLGVGI